MQGLLLECIQKASPEAYSKRVKRLGVVNAWTDPAFAEAVRATGKKQLIVAGGTTDVCPRAPGFVDVRGGIPHQSLRSFSCSSTP